MLNRIAKFCLMIILSVMVSVPVTAVHEVRFEDVPVGDWSEKDINELRALGVTSGIGGNLYGYGQTMTREEFATFLYKLYGWKSVTPVEPSFSDVAQTDWSYSYIETALSEGVIETGDGTFRPKDRITREEIGVILAC